MQDANEVLRWLAGAGAVAVASWFGSWFLEGFAFWANLAARVKQVIILALAVVLGLGATYLLSLPAETLEPYIPYLNTVVLATGAWLATQVAHRADSRAK